MRGVFSFVILFSGLQGFATGLQPEDTPAGIRVQYNSWCQGDRVMTTDQDGRVYAAWDCSEISEYSRCVELARKMESWTIITATCSTDRYSSLYQSFFCESYEDFEECPPHEPGPDDIDDGDGGRPGDDEYEDLFRINP